MKSEDLKTAFTLAEEVVNIDTAHDLVWVRLIAKFRPKSVAETAALLAITEEDAEDFLVRRESEITRAIDRVRLSGRCIENQSRRIVGKGLELIEDTLDAGEIDAEDVKDLLKVPLRVIESADRARAAEALKTDSLPVFEFVMLPGGGMRLGKHEPTVVDAEFREIKDAGGENAI
ncbi:MAG: hypothetical protein C0453_04515 [Comamonadaceae bacterium]|nr:hypothetical protein [Comamonadaceae bacterium]